MFNFTRLLGPHLSILHWAPNWPGRPWDRPPAPICCCSARAIASPWTKIKSRGQAAAARRPPASSGKESGELLLALLLLLCPAHDQNSPSRPCRCSYCQCFIGLKTDGKTPLLFSLPYFLTGNGSGTGMAGNGSGIGIYGITEMDKYGWEYSGNGTGTGTLTRTYT